MLIRPAFITNSSSSAYLFLGRKLTEDDMYSIEGRYLEYLMDIGTSGPKETLLEIVECADHEDMVEELYQHYNKKLFNGKVNRLEYNHYYLSKPYLLIRSYMGNEGTIVWFHPDELSYTEEDKKQLKMFCECIGVPYRDPKWALFEPFS